jgi:hypothetical protein
MGEQRIDPNQYDLTKEILMFSIQVQIPGKMIGFPILHERQR